MDGNLRENEKISTGSTCREKQGRSEDRKWQTRWTRGFAGSGRLSQPKIAADHAVKYPIFQFTRNRKLKIVYLAYFVVDIVFNYFYYPL